MNRAGTLIAGHDALFGDWFEESLTVRNFTEGTTDEYGDADRTLDSEVSTQGQIEMPDDPREVSNPTGQSTTTDAEILLDDSVFVTDGTSDRPFPSEIVRDSDGAIYTAVEVLDEGNGAQMVTAVSSEHE